MKKVQVTQINLSSKKIETKIDFVAEETPLHIFLNKTRYVSILCSPGQLKELAVGHLLSEGVLKSLEEIRRIQIDKDGNCQVRLTPSVDAEKRIAVSQPFARLIVSACGSADYWPLSKLMDRLSLPRSASRSKVEAKIIAESVKRLNTLDGVYRKTGGVHIAAIYSHRGDLLVWAEDVGRHNAVDKVIGAVALKKIGFDECFLASSGRLTGDIVLKAARMKIPIVASISAAIYSGIEVARLTGTTIISFVRGRRMNVLTHQERILEIGRM
ncbi:MAG: formate dehydrogenase accessory sulfurtransferase FdhD [archaeon]|nr:formate dehydrogenase accessory sulfurtransferase FdhD [archaeon]MCP8306946.1 formate dehydrogenase accessory sulfurtransferase FdhD [archaeon]